VRLLRWIAAIAALAAIAVILFANLTMKGSAPVEPWKLALLFLPWPVFFAASFPLAWESWFRRPRAWPLRLLLQVFYWLFVLTAVFVFTGIYLFLFRRGRPFS
jgi:hypothetical protein